MTIYLSRLSKGDTLSFQQAAGRRSYIFSIEGKLELNGEFQLSTGDTARVEETPSLELQASEDVFFMLIDLP